MMWLTGRLTPDFKTIADFRKDNGSAIRKVCAEFVGLCRKMNLFSQALVAIDGSKFKAVNNRDKNFSQGKMKRQQKRVEDSLDKYFALLEKGDQKETPITQEKKQSYQDRIVALREEMTRLKKIEGLVESAPDKQVSMTDPDSRAMKSRGAGIVGYNVQISVDVENHLIMDHLVTNAGSDRSQLSNMAKRAREASGEETLSVVADRGYYKGEELVACENEGIKSYVPKTDTSGKSVNGLYTRSDFRYIPEDDEYICPAGEQLPRRGNANVEKGMLLYRYFSKNCKDCPLKIKCTPGKERRIRRWEHESKLEMMEQRLEQAPENMMNIRRCTVEHPFGTLKAWMGWTHFLTKGQGNVSTEMSLHVLSYNMKRLINMFGVGSLLEKLASVG